MKISVVCEKMKDEYLQENILKWVKSYVKAWNIVNRSPNCK